MGGKGAPLNEALMCIIIYIYILFVIIIIIRRRIIFYRPKEPGWPMSQDRMHDIIEI